MKSLGIIRKIDPLGRIVLPMEVRKIFNIPEGTPMEIFTDDDGQVVLRKYAPGCVFCNNLTDVKDIDGIVVCRECAEKIHKKFKEQL